MIEASQRGVEILRILALAIRAEQDYGLTSSAPARVGARKKVAGIREAEEFIRAYCMCRRTTLFRDFQG